MSLDIGFDAQAPSLPQGGGAISGLGETFTPDLSTGVGTLNIPIDIPNGPNDIAPKVSLQYTTAAGNGPFGMGFNLTPIPRLLRSTSQGFPSFDASDTLTLEGAGDLVALGGGAFRPQVDGGAYQVKQSGDGFQLTDRSGLFYFLGTDPAARLAGDGAGLTQVYAWHLEQIADPIGNIAQFTWKRDQSQLYLSAIRYGIYLLQLNYEARPDSMRWGRAGFMVVTALRCASIELRMPSAKQPLLRRWTLTYEQDPGNGASMIAGVTLSGFAEDNTSLDAPQLKLGYSRFNQQNLIRFQTADDGPGPGPLTGSTRRVELVDWNANGLPDLIEIVDGGSARVWPNLGDATWGDPESAGTVPLFAMATAPAAFTDMNGDGIADLIRVDQPLGSYIPRDPDTGFGRPVTFATAPSPIPASMNCRLVDLNGDGIVDLLSSSEDYLALYFRASASAWAPRPQVVSRGVAPDIDLTDPHVFLADMIGDGSSDAVRVDGGGVTYWPYLGLGRWAPPVTMQNPPTLPFDVDSRRMFLTDLDGDGCADLLYLDQGRVLYWINQSGNGFSDVHSIEYVPTGAIQDARLADMLGSGTPGILWSAPGPFERATNYFYLDFSGHTKPYLLTTIDNSFGLATTIDYTTSAQQAITDAQAGTAWATYLPVVIPLVGKTTRTENSTGRVRASQYRYHNGRYDGVLREFAGFGNVDQQDLGDASVSTLLTSTWFHIGVDRQNPQEPTDEDTRLRLRAIRGRIYRQDHYASDGSPQSTSPFDRQENTWSVDTQATAGGPVYVPRLLSTKKSVFERTAAAASVITTANAAWDANGNVTDSTETAQAPGDPTQTRSLRTLTVFATDPTARFFSKAYRVQQFDTSGTLVADQITVYDNSPEGQVGSQGLVTKRSALALPDATVAAVYGASVPDLAALHYFRRAGSAGWWINQGQYSRTDDASGLHGTATGPNGAVINVSFDPTKAFPASLVDPAGNSISATYNYRVSRVATLTDAAAEQFSVTFDALARITTRVEPGDSNADPTMVFTYDTAHLPVTQLQQTRAIGGAAATVDEKSLYDGELLELEKRLFDETGEIATQSRVYNARGLVQTMYVAWRPASSAYSAPPAATPRVTMTYDALGRPLTRTNPDGGVRTWAYGPASITETDETGKTTRKLFDATGRVTAIEETLGARTLRSIYSYDIKGNLLNHTDALGNVATTKYDALSRVIQVQKPELDSINVLDAVGNPVEARTPAGITVTRVYDTCNRPVSVSTPASATPVAKYTYQDADAPPPPDAGAHTAGGRCVRVDDESGSSIFDYDERGRTVLKRSILQGVAQSYQLDLAYRSDGRLASITYPAGTGARIVLNYQYNKRGLLAAIPGQVVSVSYDLDGRRTVVQYANGVQSTYAFDDQSRPTQLNHANAVGNFRATQFSWDAASNLTRIASPDTNLASTFVYDDLHRLVTATTDAGASHSYTYDDIGNFTNKSDVGAYKYGEGGAPATCLTSAGPATFTYTAQGQMLQTPWGTQSFDGLGRLVAIAGANSAAFVYNYLGQRVSASFTVAGETSARLTPDAFYAIEDGVLVSYLYDGTRLIARAVDGGRQTFLHEDHLGSIVAMTDSGGNVVDMIRYDPFGAVLARTAAGSDVPIGFAFGQLDDVTGLLYLQARYYHPVFGRFVSADPVVQDILAPIAWNAYAYCRNNPQSYVDPTGRSWWQILLGALAIVALVALAVVTFGAATPISVALGVAVVVGVVAGGVVGGIAAAEAGGDAGSIFLGILVGAAVGGWAAFGGAAAGAALTGAIGLHGAAAAIIGGAVSGAISGAAMGFAAGFAGGNTSLDKILSNVAMGALVGAVVGAALGYVSYSFSQSSQNLGQDLSKALQSQQPQAPSNAMPPSVAPQLPPGEINDPAQALGQVGTGLAGKVAPPLIEAGVRAVIGPAFITLVVDGASGTLDLVGAPKLFNWIYTEFGLIKVSGKF